MAMGGRVGLGGAKISVRLCSGSTSSRMVLSSSQLSFVVTGTTHTAIGVESTVLMMPAWGNTGAVGECRSWHVVTGRVF